MPFVGASRGGNLESSESSYNSGSGMSSPYHENNSKAEREEVQQCLLQLVTLSPVAQQQQHQATFTAFSNMPYVLLQLQLCSWSPSPSLAPI